MNQNKIGIGTVQFGLKYGINNSVGMVDENEVKKILNTASSHQIEIIDTAYVYGKSEEVLGSFDLKNFKVVSKLPPSATAENTKQFFSESIHRLGVENLYGYIFHDFGTYEKDKKCWQILEQLKQENSVKKIGFSLYTPSQLQTIIDDKLKIDLLQIPFNILDRRFYPYLNLLADKGVEIHVRSVFLQGLFFVEIEKLNPFFAPIANVLAAIKKIATDEKITVAELALQYVLHHSAINKLILGLETVNNLAANIQAINQPEISKNSLEKLMQLPIVDEQFLMPNLWKI
ncbi:MAG: hypothetical protein RJA07_2035 [Bacteroidota bacterium]|jgi:aryl-alcohol dehydrogenase-like predicted oxidoreductase